MKNNLKNLMTLKKCTLEILSKETGISENALNTMINQKVILSTFNNNVLAKLADYFDCTIFDLYYPKEIFKLDKKGALIVDSMFWDISIYRYVWAIVSGYYFLLPKEIDKNTSMLNQIVIPKKEPIIEKERIYPIDLEYMFYNCVKRKNV